MIHILKIGKTINFVEFDMSEFRQILEDNNIYQDIYKSNGEIEMHAEDKWMWDHRYMFLTFHRFNTIDEAMEFINNSVIIQDEIREENLVYSNIAFKYFSPN